jgi:ATP:corrinoid adenosyltransferase
MAQVDQLNQDVNVLDGKVENIENSDIFALDANNPADQEVVFTGGGAPIETGEV